MKIYACVTAIMTSIATAASAFQLKSGKIVSSASNLSISYIESPGTTGSGPATLFIHGLDSSSQTWQGVQQYLSTPSVAIDCRGCGRSELGDVGSFSPDALVEDVKSLSQTHPLLRNKRFVLVGHSMGGRLAINYAAKYPEDVSAVVIEDMDIKRRSVKSNFIQNFDENKAIAFDRNHESLDSLKKELESIGYPEDMYSKWINEGRIYQEEGTGKYWSDVNPAFRALCYRTIFDSDCGTESWSNIAQHANMEGDTSPKYHLMGAGVGTVCDQESIDDMSRELDTLSVKTYAQGTHSIHNSVREEFMADLNEIISYAQNRKPNSSL